jgi:uncharacterized MnhB-related membrane protein
MIAYCSAAASSAGPPPSTAAPVLAALQVILLLLVAAAATAVVLTRNQTRQIVILSMYGVLLAVLFLVFQAPDVTLSELTVGAVILPLLLLLTLAKTRGEPASGGPRSRPSDSESDQQ